MDDTRIQLLEYITEEGENLFHNWLNSLNDRTARARIRVRLNRVRLGNFGDCKKSQPKDIQLAQDFWADYKRRAK